MKKILLIFLSVLFFTFASGSEQPVIAVLKSKDYNSTLLFFIFRSTKTNWEFLSSDEIENLKKGKIKVTFENDKGDTETVKGYISSSHLDTIEMSVDVSTKVRNFIEKSDEISITAEDKTGKKIENIRFDVKIVNDTWSQNNGKTEKIIKKEPVANWKALISGNKGRAEPEFITVDNVTENEAINELIKHCKKRGFSICEAIVYQKYAAVSITKDGIHYLARSEKSSEDAVEKAINGCEKEYKVSCTLVKAYD